MLLVILVNISLLFASYLILLFFCKFLLNLDLFFIIRPSYSKTNYNNKINRNKSNKQSSMQANQAAKALAYILDIDFFTHAS